MEGWQEQVQDAVQRRAVRAMLDALAARITPHAGTPNAADKRWVERTLTKGIGDPEEQFEAARLLLAEPEPVAAELAAMLLARCFPTRPDDALDTLRAIADHPNWEVREYAGSSLGRLLDQDWERTYPACAEWSRDPSPNVRRAVLLAVREAAKSRLPGRGEPLLDLLTPLLSDPNLYVKRNLGPFALGDALLRCYPIETIARLEEWSEHSDVTVRWNVAMSLGTAAAGSHPLLARGILLALSTDARPPVRRAVATAMRRLGFQPEQHLGSR